MTTIEWTDHTINCLVGCTKVRAKGAKSSGCEHCYAARASKSGRLQQFPQYHGVVDEKGNWTGQVNFVPEQLEKLFKFRKPTRVFMPSMSDPFHSAVKDEWLDQIFAAIALNPQVTVQMLTKRPKRMRDYLRSAKNRIRIAAVDKGRSANVNHKVLADLESCQWDWPLSNLWLGVSVENQKAADERIPLLGQTPASIRFLSCEPLLEAVDLNLASSSPIWCITGGESGPGARPCDVAWIRLIRDQCKSANIPVFIKQLGSNPVGVPKLRSAKGGDAEEWPKDLRVREFPEFG
ncbi:DUF5131 family protein [Acaryochloris sp. CCMEE 5410]|uniref:DUF5131 family protein n=1 Tax=Acaryochloris sp. CCMEE 5410 TaxID=310037 RepID=UPI0002484EFB|nr:DUF5131 family protein [Acaryochloris sp. CCMEE 5410]KAI9129841.1 phage Gp37/Gp68 family protein [Acaryochloris sp. CCMEE 5410]